MSKLTTLLFVAVVLTCTVVQAQTAPELRSHVEYLASDEMGGRYPASEGMAKAKAYVRAECKKLGLQTFTQDVSVRGGTCQNIIAVLPGRTDDRIVVGAHLDHIGGAKGRVNNGADDNASGCAAVLGLAKRLAETKPGCTIEFHFYTGEEQGLLGSKTYCRKPLADLSKYKFMLNLDMVGRLDRAGKKLIGTAPGLDLDAILSPLYEKYAFADGATWASDTGDSDHSSWWKAGVPAVIVHTGLHKDYHRPTGDSDKIDYRGMVDVCDYSYDIVRAVDAVCVPGSPVEEDPFILY